MLRLTNAAAGFGKPVYVNPDRVIFIESYPVGQDRKQGCRLHIDGVDKPILVQETIEQVDDLWDISQGYAE